MPVARYEPFSQRLHELREKGLFRENGFSFLPLKPREYVASDVRASDLQPPRNRHMAEAERQGTRNTSIFEVLPELHERFFDSRSRQEQRILGHVRRFLDGKSGQDYVAHNPPAKLLWDALAAVDNLNNQILGLSEHFPDFNLDVRLSNVLFRGFNAKGEPILSVIDQNPR